MTDQTTSQSNLEKPSDEQPREAGSTRKSEVVLLVLGLFAQWAFYYFPTQRAQIFPEPGHPDFFALLMINLSVVALVGWLAWLCLGRPERKLSRLGLVGVGLYGGAILGVLVVYPLLTVAKQHGHFDWSVALFLMRTAPCIGLFITLPAIYFLRHKSIWLHSVIAITLAGLILAFFGRLLAISCYNVEHMIPDIKRTVSNLQPPCVAALAVFVVVFWHRRPGADPIHQFHLRQPLPTPEENIDRFSWTMITLGTITLIVGLISVSFVNISNSTFGSVIITALLMLYPITSGLLVHWYINNRLYKLSAGKRLIQLIRSSWVVACLGVIAGVIGGFIAYVVVGTMVETLTQSLSPGPMRRTQYDLVEGIAGICTLASGLLIIVLSLKKWGKTLDGPAFDQLWIIGLAELPLGVMLMINAADWGYVSLSSGTPLLTAIAGEAPFFILGLSIASVGFWALSSRLKLDKDVYISLQNQASFCHACGYNLTGTLAAGRDVCPECGAKFTPPVRHDAINKTPSNETH